MDKLLELEKKIWDSIVSDNIVSLIKHDAREGTGFSKDAYSSYSRIFGLCKILGIRNIYDIGCRDWQPAFLLVDFPGIYYTGIDYHDIDYKYLNRLFADYKNIKFQYGYYPFSIKPARNNIAVSHYAMGTMVTNEEKIKIITNALSKDFKRILINIEKGRLNIWEAGLADFKLYTLDCMSDDNIPLVFGTKFPKEIDKLEKMGYRYLDDKFSISLL
jgi:SAM-dependent methyltransferase